jgi:gamma-glutamyltranspeptidase / glutathione hydrolase
VRRLALALVVCGGVGFALGAQPVATGVQDPAFAPDGKSIAFSWREQIYVSSPDGRGARALRSASTDIERDPAWSPDGRSIAFAADAGNGFDIYIAPANGKSEARKLTTTAGDERWPSWTRDGRLVFSARDGWRWRLFVADAAKGEAAPLFPDTAATDEEREGRVSPDGKRVAYVSTRESEDGDVDLWVAELPLTGAKRVRRTRVVRARGVEGFPSWSPDGSRIAFYAAREGAGSVWVAPVEPLADADAPPARPRPVEPPVLVSRHGGTVAWSPDGRRLAIADLPDPDPTYNGNPLRSADPPPPAFVPDAFALWMVDAPMPVDSGARALTTKSAVDRPLVSAFDRVWETLRRLYYREGSSADEWRRLKEKHRPQAAAAHDQAQLEDAVDAMVAEQPLIKPVVTSDRAVVVSGHPLASRAGVLALEKGGNIVDAAIAVSFALGVVEPDASGVGGDGMALVFLKGMSEPVVVDYKDQVPIKATRDNPALQQSTGDGPSAANIPGVVAGLDLLYRRFGSRKVSWADLIAPAIEYAEQGYVLDEALPTSIVEGRKFFEKYAESKRIYLPGGKVPRPGDRFVNKDYAATLRAIAADGAQTFYRGALARRIADDMMRHGGIITLDDLAQYRAIERRPLAGRYRDYAVFSAPPPVSTGLQMIETLQILQNYSPRAGATYATDADFLHYAIEAWKVRDQGARVNDPALFDVDLGVHLDPAHAAELFKRIDPKKASRYRTDVQGRGGAGTSVRLQPDPSGSGVRLQPDPVGSGVRLQPDPDDERIGRGTTAFAVADADGNMIALTQTLSTWGGTFYVSEGLGFLYNNHLRFGGGGAPGRLLPLMRSSSTSVPTLLFTTNADRTLTPRLAVGAAGNAWIPASVYDVILNVIDGGLHAQRAIEAPRFLVGRDPGEPEVGRMLIEDRIPRSILLDLMARGHRFQKIGRKGEVRYGYAAAVVVDPASRTVEAGAEPRRSHAAVAVQK